MNLAILHYHLNPGGVTGVIARHLRALAATAPPGERIRVLVLSDGQTSGWPANLPADCPTLDIRLQSIASLGYADQATRPVAEPVDHLLQALRRALQDAGFAPQSTIVHAHNHSLGKNPAIAPALRQLACDGYAVLLQPHDFAEDFRSSNYRLLRAHSPGEALARNMYFQGARVHYATLSCRDGDVLRQAGVRENRLHHLPNAVDDAIELPSVVAARQAVANSFGISRETEYVLYPVRGIRRKNVGEFVLLSALRNADLRRRGSDRTSVFGITLAPRNPEARLSYEHWRAVAQSLDLPCRFDVGQAAGVSFHENLAAADLILTTSVAEGFGMAFLESWLAGRRLIGRDLPEITADFVAQGLRLEGLYARLNVPVAWLGRRRIETAFERAVQRVYADYNLTPPIREQVEAAVESLIDESVIEDGLIDFGRLDEPLQEQVIRRVTGSIAESWRLLDVNPALARWDEVTDATVAANRAVIRNDYSLAASGRRLRTVYNSLLAVDEATLDAPADPQSVLRAFLRLDRFQLLRA